MAGVVLIKLLGLVSLMTYVQSVCQDLDASACAKIKAVRPDMCDDPCITVLCSDTCNNCPLKCYKCENQISPEDCSNVIQCPTSNHVCVAYQTLTADYIPLFSSGCETRDVCLKVFGNINIRRRAVLETKVHPRGLSLLGGCCDIDKCNIHDPEREPTEPPGYVRTTIPSNINPTYSSSQITCTAVDLDADACLAMKAADPNICSKHCVAEKLCQGMCQTCLQCFKCDGVRNLSDCNTTTACDIGQKCVMVQELDNLFMPRYRVGCMNSNVCSTVFGPSSQQGLGKRQFRLTGGCCDQSFCNNQTSSVSG